MWCTIVPLGYKAKAYLQLRDALFERIKFLEEKGYNFYRLFMGADHWDWHLATYKGFVLNGTDNVELDKGYILNSITLARLFIDLTRLLGRILVFADGYWGPGNSYRTLAAVNACQYYGYDIHDYDSEGSWELIDTWLK